MTLSKKDKEELIRIEKCERTAKLYEIKDRLQNQKEKIEAPFNERIKKIEIEKRRALEDKDLLYIDGGCGRQNAEIQKFDQETHEIIKKILRE